MNGAHKVLARLVVMIAVIGFPRIYGTEIPLAVAIAPFYGKLVFQFAVRHAALAKWISALFVLWFSSGLFAFLAGDGLPSDIFFHIVTAFKLCLTYYFSIVVLSFLKDDPKLLIYWLVAQMSIIVMSVVSDAFYVHLLGYISPRSADVFQHVLGLRAVGFGIFHVDGGINLATGAFLASLLMGGAATSLLLLLLLPLSMMVARSSLIPYVIYALIGPSKTTKVIISLLFISMAVMVPFVESGPLYEALEVFRNLYEIGELQSSSVSHLETMYSWPDNIYTLIFGDGKYFQDIGGDLAFYQFTDVGYLRLIYFGGLPFCVLFYVLNLLPCVWGICTRIMFFKSMEYKIFCFASILILLSINLKGLQNISIFAFIAALYLIDLKANDQMSRLGILK